MCGTNISFSFSNNDEVLPKNRGNDIDFAMPSTSKSDTTKEKGAVNEESQWFSSWETLEDFRNEHDSMIQNEEIEDKPTSKPRGRPPGKKNKSNIGRKTTKGSMSKTNR